MRQRPPFSPGAASAGFGCGRGGFGRSRTGRSWKSRTAALSVTIGELTATMKLDIHPVSGME
jgi:hypothetical protein